jgi:hypothetical protein
MPQPFLVGDGHQACGICPGRRLPFGAFDVAERPSKDCPFDPVDGHRYTAARVPVCVHPEKVGVPTAPYCTDGVPLACDLELPDGVAELDRHLHAAVHAAAPGTLDVLITRAIDEIPRRYHGVDATTALRRALS